MLHTTLGSVRFICGPIQDRTKMRKAKAKKDPECKTHYYKMTKTKATPQLPSSNRSIQKIEVEIVCCPTVKESTNTSFYQQPLRRTAAVLQPYKVVRPIGCPCPINYKQPLLQPPNFTATPKTTGVLVFDFVLVELFLKYKQFCLEYYFTT